MWVAHMQGPRVQLEFRLQDSPASLLRPCWWLDILIVCSPHPSYGGLQAYGFTTSLAVGVGCTSPNKKRQLACLRKVDWKVLAQATPPEKAVFEPVNKVFFPVVDGLIIPRQPMELLQDGQMQKGTKRTPPTLSHDRHCGTTCGS